MACTQCSIPLLGGPNQRRILWISFILVQIATQCFQHSTWSVLTPVTTSWGLNTLHLNIILKSFNWTTSQPNCCFLRQNCQRVPPKWAIMRDLAQCTRGEHFNVKMVSKIKIKAHLAKNWVVCHWKYQFSENCCLLTTASRHHNGLTGKTRCSHE